MENNLAEMQPSERLTFYQLFNEKKYLIEIPIIQRDYAQGRESNFEIRNMFLDSIYDHLDKNISIDLDFVYGSLINDNPKGDTRFIPLDGQQRLTTLFLLHWYLANKDSQIDALKEKIIANNKSKFTYQTRTSSGEFCDALFINNIKFSELLLPDQDKKNSLSKTIRDSSWFFLSWEFDPTIKAMLVMLDSIHDKFMNSNGFYTRLIDSENPVITFQYLNLKEFKLSDDLYIKMNARGKPLTPFENFKAKFEQLINETEFIKTPQFCIEYNSTIKYVSVKEYFSQKIDTSWANLFWNYRDIRRNIFDEQLMNFIRVLSTNSYASREKEENKFLNLKYLIGKEDPENKDESPASITYSKFKEINCFDEKCIIDLIKTIDLIAADNNTIKQYLTEKFYYNEVAIFNGVIKNNLNYTERIKLFAFYQYLILNKSGEGLSDWMRIIHNLSENTIYNSIDDYSKSIHSITNLLPNSTKIINYLKDKQIDGFNGQQVYEERIKSILILKNEDWRIPILDLEKHGYFRGQIGFVLKFSGIFDYFGDNMTRDLSEDQNKLFYDLFINYSQKAKVIFGANGLNEFNNYIWERALLTKGNYFLAKGSNQSFLINRHRDISWKRLLRVADKYDGYYEKKRNFIKDVFDDIDFDILDIENGLIKIINKSNVEDWRKHFIKLKEIIGYCEKRQVRILLNGLYVMLLYSVKLSGKHRELYSYSFYLNYITGINYFPFTRAWYHEVSGDEENPCAVIGEWKYNKSNYSIDIYFDYHINKYKLRLFDRNGQSIDEPIKKIALDNDFNCSELLNEYVIYLAENEIEEKLNSICSLFNAI